MQKTGFGTLNWVVLLVYLLAMLLIGAYFTNLAHGPAKILMPSLRQTVLCRHGQLVLVFMLQR